MDRNVTTSIFPDGTLHNSPSSTTVLTRPSTSSSSAAALGSRPSLATTATTTGLRGPGRPATARQVWQQPGMQRRLVRLYLYTSKESLNTQQMSKLLSALARLERDEASTAASSPEAKPPSLQSEIRSTQKELNLLLSERYRLLRPRNREVARARLADLRLVRDRRSQKARLRRRAARRASTDSTTLEPSGSETRMTTTSGLPLGENADQLALELQLAGTANRLSCSASTISTRRSSTIDGELNGHKPVRLSWLREKLTTTAGERPTSSVILEIRSLLSRNSIRSSLLSRTSSRSSKNSLPEYPLSVGDNASHRNTLLIRLCCSHREDCLHKKALSLIEGEGHLTVPQITVKDLDAEYLSFINGRDIWNETLLHLVARWGGFNLCELLMDLLSRCDSSIINVRNIDGDTFLHLLARRWGDVPFSFHCNPSSFAEIVARASLKGLDFQSCNLKGMNFLTTLVCRLSPSEEGTIRVVDALWSVHDNRDIPRWQVLSSVGPVAVNFLSALSSKHDSYHECTPVSRFVHGHYEVSLRQYLANGHSVLDVSPTVLSLHGYLENETALSTLAATPYLLDDLLIRGADPNEYNAMGKTCLMALIEQVHGVGVAAQLPQVLLKHGADLKLLDREGNTALHYAVRNRLPDVVQQLIDAGVDVQARNMRDETAPELAVRQYTRSAKPGGSGLLYASSQTLLVRFFDEKVRRRKREVERVLVRIPEEH